MNLKWFLNLWFVIWYEEFLRIYEIRIAVEVVTLE